MQCKLNVDAHNVNLKRPTRHKTQGYNCKREHMLLCPNEHRGTIAMYWKKMTTFALQQTLKLLGYEGPGKSPHSNCGTRNTDQHSSAERHGWESEEIFLCTQVKAQERSLKTAGKYWLKMRVWSWNLTAGTPICRSWRGVTPSNRCTTLNRQSQEISTGAKIINSDLENYNIRR